MLTNNWRMMLSKVFSKTQEIRTWDGIFSISLPNSYGFNKRFYIGTGTTAPKQTDYKIETAISESDYISSAEIVCDTGKGSFLKESGLYVSGTITNTSTKPLEISEIGVSASSTSSNEGSVRYLLAREVFDTPITIPPGGVQAFSLKLF